MHANYSNKKTAIPNQQGFTLIEVLVAMALGLIIIGGAFSYFLSTLKTSKAMLSQSKLQQEIRASADLMQRDLRRAGYKPNGSTANVGTIYLGKTDAALSANNCVLYSYVNEQNVLRVSGFLLHNNKLYMYTQSGTATNDCPSSADTNAAWSPMTLGSNNKITLFNPTIDDNGSRPLLRLAIKGELSHDAQAVFELSQQITLHNAPATADAI